MKAQRSWLQNPVIEGLGVSLGLFVGLVVWEIINGHSEGIEQHLIEGAQPTTMTIVVLLTGFIWGASRNATIAFRRDLAPLIPQLRGSADELEDLFQRFDLPNNQKPRFAGGIGALVGVLVISEPGGGTPWLFSGQPWTHGFAAAVSVNILLF